MPIKLWFSIRNKSVLFIIGLLILLLAGVLIGYQPFLEEQFSFQVIVDNGETHVLNKNFDIEFDISSECLLDGSVFNYLGSRLNWGGILKCGEERWLSLYVWSEDQLSYGWKNSLNTLNGNERILVHYSTGVRDSASVNVISSDETKVFIISFHPRQQELFDEVIDSLKTIEE